LETRTSTSSRPRARSSVRSSTARKTTDVPPRKHRYLPHSRPARSGSRMGINLELLGHPYAPGRDTGRSKGRRGCRKGVWVPFLSAARWSLAVLPTRIERSGNGLPNGGQRTGAEQTGWGVQATPPGEPAKSSGAGRPVGHRRLAAVVLAIILALAAGGGARPLSRERTVCRASAW
jgi:hypothetical protein